MSEIARPRTGETVRVEGWGDCTVLDSSDPSLITLRIEWTGRLVRVGDVALLTLIADANGEDARPTT